MLSNIPDRIHYYNEQIRKIEEMVNRKKEIENQLKLNRTRKDLLLMDEMQDVYSAEELEKLINEVSEITRDVLEETYALSESINVSVFETKLLKEKLIPLEFSSQLLELPAYNHYSLPKKVRRKQFLEEQRKAKKSE